MKDRGQTAFEAYNQPGCHWAFQGAGERARWAAVECAVLFRAPPIGDARETPAEPGYTIDETNAYDGRSR